METRSFMIPANNRAEVEDRIAKLNKRAIKLGMDPIVLIWDRPILADNDQMLFPVDMTGPLSVSHAGWEFVATLQHLPTGESIIRSISDEHQIPLEYRSSGSACQHCNVNRYRRDTYVVRHESGEFKQVGSTCIKDFLGGNSPDNIMMRACLLGDLFGFMQGATHGPPAPYQEGVWHIVSILSHANAVIRTHGWVPKSKATDHIRSTVSRVEDNLDTQACTVKPEDKLKAKQAAEWAENISDSDAEFSDYLYNIRAIARSSMVGYRTMGYACSILSAYDRFLNKEKKFKSSEHLGQVKDRVTFHLTAKSITGFNSRYGYCHKIIFNDNDGNVLVWLTSNDQMIEEGKSYDVKGTIKAHTEYRGVKQTEITRCEVNEHV
jgi:hypothetical protein